MEQEGCCGWLGCSIPGASAPGDWWFCALSSHVRICRVDCGGDVSGGPVPISSQMTQAAVLYFSDSLLIVLFLAGVAWLVDRVVARSLSRFFVEVSASQLSRLILFQVGVVLFALVGFKFVVLSGGPGIAVRSILAHGRFTRSFSVTALVLALGLVLVGAVRVVRAVRSFVRRRWL